MGEAVLIPSMTVLMRVREMAAVLRERERERDRDRDRDRETERERERERERDRQRVGSYRVAVCW